jgi:hypothetical protein
MSSLFYGPTPATYVVSVNARTAPSPLPTLPLVSIVPTFDVYRHINKPAHRCHDICSALTTRIVETFQREFKY